MTKLVLTKKSEISVTEEKKGKQIAVKENNITSLKQFFQSNYTSPISPVMPTPSPVAPTPQIVPEMLNQQPQPTINNIDPTPMIQPMAPVIENAINNPTAQTIVTNEPVIAQAPVVNQAIETPVITNPVEPNPVVNPTVLNNEMTQPVNPIPVISTPIQNLETENNDGTGATEAINLVPETIINEQLEDEMDPELKEIKDRLNQVINDLNNYKKKIKILETEVNQNLEKSREVLKDTQAAAKIMAIQQERQRQITEEITGSAPVNDPSRILQKEN